jgi:hypothetical protein
MISPFKVQLYFYQSHSESRLSLPYTLCLSQTPLIDEGANTVQIQS